MPQLRVLLREPRKSPEFIASTIKLPVNASTAISEMHQAISRAYGEEVPIAIEISPTVTGAAVGVGTDSGTFSIQISAGPTRERFEAIADQLLPHEICHVFINAHGIPVLYPNCMKDEIINSAIMDISDHPFIWAAFKKYGLQWKGIDKAQMDKVFLPKYESERTRFFKEIPLFSAKQYADLYFSDRTLFQSTKDRLPGVLNGDIVLRYLEEIEEARDAIGDNLFTIDGVKLIRLTLMEKWRYRPKSKQWFKSPLP